MEHVLELKNISHSYHNTEGETPALKDLSFLLKKGEFIALSVLQAVENPRCCHSLQDCSFRKAEQY